MPCATTSSSRLKRAEDSSTARTHHLPKTRRLPARLRMRTPPSPPTHPSLPLLPPPPPPPPPLPLPPKMLWPKTPPPPLPLRRRRPRHKAAPCTRPPTTWACRWNQRWPGARHRASSTSPGPPISLRKCARAGKSTMNHRWASASSTSRGMYPSPTGSRNTHISFFPSPSHYHRPR